MKSQPHSPPSIPQKLPVVITSNVSKNVDAILAMLTSKDFLFTLEAETMLEAFQLLLRFGGGVMVVMIDSTKEQAAFYKSLTVLLQSVESKNLRIVFFSRKNEILDSRALAQFQFIRPYAVAKTIDRVAELVSREYKTLLTTESVTKSAAPQMSSAEKPGGGITTTTTVVAAATPAQVYPNPGAEIDDPLLDCLGVNTPSYLFPLDLAWRVRGFFESVDRTKGHLIFRVVSERAENRVTQYFDSHDVAITSSSGPQGRICFALEIVRDGNKKFVFSLPNLTKVIQRRSSFRKKVPHKENGFARIYDPARRATRLFSLYDYGPGGFGVLIEKDLVDTLSVGQAFYDVSLYIFGKEYSITECELRHISVADIEPGHLLVGMKFKKISKSARTQLEVSLFAQGL